MQSQLPMKPAIKLSDIRKTLPFTIRMGSSSDSISRMAIDRPDITFDYDVFLPSKGKNLQRPFCWTLEQKQSLILSIFKGVELTSISIIIFTDDMTPGQRDQKIYKIIDGKQRVSTLIGFIRNEFPIIVNGESYFFNELPAEMISVLNRFTLTQNIVYEYPDKMISDNNKIAWFEMINFAGTPQDIEHLNNLKS